MNRLQALVSFVCAIALYGYASSARAATCTVSGTIHVETEDEYYCDTTIAGSSGCSGWLVKDLDSTFPPIRGARVFVVDGSGNRSSYGSTNESGVFSFTFNSTEFGQSSCSSLSVKLGLELRRSTGSGGLFRIVEDDGSTTQALIKSGNIAFTSGSASIPWTLGSTTAEQHLGTVYQTADSALWVIRGWNTNMSNAFNKTSSATDGSGIFRIMHDTSVQHANFWPDFLIRFGWDRFREGATLRHEIGHAVHWEAHERIQNIFSPDFSQNAQCLSYNMNSHLGHSTLGCEYGFTAMVEGMATFFAVRSIYSGNSTGNAWYCFCADGSNSDQDECTEIAVHSSTMADTDRVVGDDNGQANCFIGIGDDFSNAPSNCVRLTQSDGCSCTGNCSQGQVESFGYQNENQIVRFLWDMIDGGSESGDDTDESIGGILADLAAMPCTAASGLTPDGSGQRDGNCNEPNYESTCVPSLAWPPVSGDQRGTRDSYNVRDLEPLIAGDQSGERSLNCQSGSDD